MSRNKVSLDAFLQRHRSDIIVLDLVKCVDEAVEKIRPQIEAKNQTLIIQLSPLSKVRANKEGLIRVLAELLFNAHKFTPSQGEIILKSEKLDQYVKVSISDTGIGIPAEFQGSIFGRINSLRGRNVIADTGLGLAMTKIIVEDFGGEVGCESELNKGSTFWFTIKLASTQKAG